MDKCDEGASPSYPSPHGEGGQAVEYNLTRELTHQIRIFILQVCALFLRAERVRVRPLYNFQLFANQQHLT
jgi:hypothetical protein